MLGFRRPFVKRPIPNCNRCKYHSSGKCKLFKYTNPHSETLINAEVCRKDPMLCGSMGIFFKEKNLFKWILEKLK